jgi:predicted nucleic acid-binding protein
MRHRRVAEDKPGGPCFIDTSAFYALLDADDSHHSKAVGLFNQLARSRARLLTSNHVLFETYSLILSRLGQWMAQSWLRKLNMRVERTAAEDEQRAVQIVLEFRDKGFSLVDASSFALMERLGLRRAIAFDPHFRQYGRFMVLQQLAEREESSR